jgi:hypothetical protein
MKIPQEPIWCKTLEMGDDCNSGATPTTNKHRYWPNPSPKEFLNAWEQSNNLIHPLLSK